MPAWIFEQAKDKEHLKQLVLEYMQRYPDYVVKSVKKKFAVCERRYVIRCPEVIHFQLIQDYLSQNIIKRSDQLCGFSYGALAPQPKRLNVME